MSRDGFPHATAHRVALPQCLAHIWLFRTLPEKKIAKNTYIKTPPLDHCCRAALWTTRCWINGSPVCIGLPSSEELDSASCGASRRGASLPVLSGAAPSGGSSVRVQWVIPGLKGCFRVFQTTLPGYVDGMAM